jgi:small subunit ribosomal protein S18
VFIKRETRRFTRLRKEAEFGPIRKKFCRFCVEKAKDIDYKDVKKLEKAVNERYKILSRKYSGVCAKHQRKLKTAIKLARYIGLMPYVRA